MSLEEDVKKILDLKVDVKNLVREEKVLEAKILDLDNDKLNFNGSIARHLKLETLSDADLLKIKDLLIDQIEKRFTAKDLTIFAYLRFNELTKTKQTQIKKMIKARTQIELEELKEGFYSSLEEIKNIGAVE